jgi:hypothetical protein
VFVSTQPAPPPPERSVERSAAGPGGFIPALLAGLIDDAAVFPPGNATVPAAIAAHRQHRGAWYRDLIGPLLLPASALPEAAGRVVDGTAADRPLGFDPVGVAPADRLGIGVVGDAGLDALAEAVVCAAPRMRLRQIELAVAKRGEDPQPGLRRLLTRLGGWPSIAGYAEIPLTWGLLGALDTVAEGRADGLDIAPKFRTGGLAAELFPTPVELAAVICACRDRQLPFKLTAGLHQALRHTDPETGFVHHGFLNVLVATAVAVDGAEVAEVAEVLANTDPAPLVDAASARRDRPRPLWVGLGSCSVVEPLTDLVRLGLVDGGYR